MRSCPRCGYPLSPTAMENMEVDHCRRCGGTFLDPGESAAILGPFASPETWQASDVARRLGPTARRCPRDRTPLVAHTVALDRQAVEVDLCDTCRGLWIDAGEAEVLRELVMEAAQNPEVSLPARTGASDPRTYLFQLFTGLPVEVWNPVRHRPRATLALIAALAAVFSAELLLGAEPLFAGLAMIPAEVLAGRGLWTLLTSAFLHADLFHFGANAYMLYVFGDNVEDFLGGPRYLALWFGSALVGSALQALTQSDPTIPVVGASGAVAGVMGAYVVLFSRVRLYQVLFFIRFRIGAVWYVGLWLALNILLLFSGDVTIAWMSHIGGALTGIVFALTQRRRLQLRFAPLPAG